MSSREVARLLGIKHADVRRLIEALAEKGIINLSHKATYSTGQRGRPSYEYHVIKRDSYVIVAQLSPEATARLVDRWQELEGRVGRAVTSAPEWMRSILESNKAVMELLSGNIMNLDGSIREVSQEVAGNTKAIVSLNSRVPEMPTVAL
jgi:phage regulator Rha-like protein